MNVENYRNVFLFAVGLLLFFLHPMGLNAQLHYQISVGGGPQNIGGNTVNVTFAGSVSINPGNICAIGPSNNYWLGNRPGIGPGSYTYTFTTPVNSIRILATALHEGEVLGIEVNGVPYTLTNANLTRFLGNCNLYEAELSGGNLICPIGKGIPGTFPGSGGKIDIWESKGIQTFMVKALSNQRGDGFVYNISFGSVFPSNNSASLCPGDTLKLFCEPSLAGASYEWRGPSGFGARYQNPYILNAGPAQEGIYSVKVKTATDSIMAYTEVTLLPRPPTPVLTTNSPICEGDTLTLSAFFAPDVSFIWSGPGDFYSDQLQPSRAPIQSSHAGNYSAISISSDGCKSLPGKATVSVIPIKKYSFSDIICAGATYDFNGKKLSSPGDYADTFSSSLGCDSIRLLHLMEVPAPELEIRGWDNTSLCLGDTIRLIANGAQLYTWYDKEGKEIGVGNEVAIPIPALINDISVLGIALNNCTDTATFKLQAESCCGIFIPTAFSPNGDGLNDLFQPVGLRPFLVSRLEIFNRWGQRVYSGNQPDSYWDGTINGVVADMGTYYYHVISQCADEKEINRKGMVSLIR